jgi:hypothetical protein
MGFPVRQLRTDPGKEIEMRVLCYKQASDGTGDVLLPSDYQHVMYMDLLIHFLPNTEASRRKVCCAHSTTTHSKYNVKFSYRLHIDHFYIKTFIIKLGIYEYGLPVHRTVHS